MLGELHKYERVLRARVRRVRRWPIQQNANVRDDHLALLLGNYCADCVFDSRDQLLGFFHAQPGRRAHFDHELSRVGLREKFRAD